MEKRGLEHSRTKESRIKTSNIQMFKSGSNEFEKVVWVSGTAVLPNEEVEADYIGTFCFTVTVGLPTVASIRNGGDPKVSRNLHLFDIVRMSRDTLQSALDTSPMVVGCVQVQLMEVEAFTWP